MLPAVSRQAPPRRGAANGPLLTVRHVTKHFPVRGGVLLRTIGHIHAVDDVSFEVERGENLGLVGESGCGKTTIGRVILRIYPPTAGAVFFDGRDIASLSRRELATKMQIIFQDPYGSLNPRVTVGSSIGESMEINKIGTRQERMDRVRAIMEVVGLYSQYAQRYPHEFSGGQRQRVGLARALVLHPELIVCDEPVSALDVSIQSQILNLLKDLQGEFGLTYLFISHNLAVVKYVCSRVAVMYFGKLAEVAGVDELFRMPLHPYTQALMAAIPVPDPRQRRDRDEVQGEPPSSTRPPSGCRFHTRCPLAQDVCREAEPVLTNYGHDHWVACHAVDQRLGRGTPSVSSP